MLNMFPTKQCLIWERDVIKLFCLKMNQAVLTYSSSPSSQVTSTSMTVIFTIINIPFITIVIEAVTLTITTRFSIVNILLNSLYVVIVMVIVSKVSVQ